MLREQLAGRSLTFSSEIGDAVSEADAVFICVGTPPGVSGEANLVAFEQAAREIARRATGPLTVVEKSTVPAGTAGHLERTMLEERPDLRERSMWSPIRSSFRRRLSRTRSIPIGSSSGRRRLERSRRCATSPAPRGRRRAVDRDGYHERRARQARLQRVPRAEDLVRNALARIRSIGRGCRCGGPCDGGGSRIGPDFLGAGLGFGGYCLPKDLSAFEHSSRRLGYPFPLLAEVARINDEAIQAAMSKIRDVVWNLEGKRVALLGLSFKPATDDVRFSPSLILARSLLGEGTHVVGYDPVAGSAALVEVPELELAADRTRRRRVPIVSSSARHGTAPRTRSPPPRQRDGSENLVDGRNLLDAAAVNEAGFAYRAMGRPGSFGASGP